MADRFNSYTRPLRRWLDNDIVRDVCINKPGTVYVDTENGWAVDSAPEITSTWINGFAQICAKETSQSIGPDNPILSGTMPTGERVQIVQSPAASHTSITIRRPASRLFTLEELDDQDRLDPKSIESTDQASILARLRPELTTRELLYRAVRSRLNIIVSGATGSGKTTLSKALICAIPLDERLISIEDAAELEFNQPNHVRLFYSRAGAGRAKVTPQDLLIAVLRMRPDRVMLSELRDEEAYMYLRNVNSGHPGSITTIHANSPTAAIDQLILLIKQSPGGRGLSRDDIRALIIGLVDVIIQMENTRVTAIYFPRFDHV